MCTHKKGERGLSLQAILKWGNLTGPQPLEGVCWERWGDFLQGGGGLNFHIKNKLKSDKKMT